MSTKTARRAKCGTETLLVGTQLYDLMTEHLFNTLKAIETFTAGRMKVYGLPSGQAMAFGQSINLHSAFR